MSEEREARITELRAAIKIECCGLRITQKQAATIIDCLDRALAVRQSAGAPPINDDLKATSGPLLELDVLLAKFHDAVWSAAADETGKIAYDEAGSAECKAIQQHVRAMLAGESNACPHGVDDGACKQCYVEATGQEPVAKVSYKNYCANVVWLIDPPLPKGALLYGAPIGGSHESAGTKPVGVGSAAPIGDNGAKSSGSAEWDYGNGLVDKKLDPSYAQPAESKRVELTPTDIRAIANSYDLDNAPQIVEFSRALLARAQAKGE